MGAIVGRALFLCWGGGGAGINMRPFFGRGSVFCLGDRGLTSLRVPIAILRSILFFLRQRPTLRCSKQLYGLVSKKGNPTKWVVSFLLLKQTPNGYNQTRTRVFSIYAK